MDPVLALDLSCSAATICNTGQGFFSHKKKMRKSIPLPRTGSERYSPGVVVVGLVVRWMRIEDVVQYGSGAFEQLPVLVDRFDHHGRCRRIKIHRVDRSMALLLS